MHFDPEIQSEHRWRQISTPNERSVHARESVETNSTTRVFLQFEGDRSEREALENAANRFRPPLLRYGFEFAGTTEMEEVYAVCRDSVGVSATEERECQLQAARRIFVRHLISLAVEPRGQRAWEITVQVWDPDSNSLVYEDLVEVDSESLGEAVRVGLPSLASSYLCFIGRETECY